MSIVRAARKSNFYVCPSSVIEDRRLSWAARGLLVYLLSKPDNWFIQIKDLLNQTMGAIGGRSGRDKVYKLLNELRAAGYVYQEFVREGGASGASSMRCLTPRILSKQRPTSPASRPKQPVAIQSSNYRFRNCRKR
jgi:hypothetical protein